MQRPNKKFSETPFSRPKVRGKSLAGNVVLTWVWTCSRTALLVEILSRETSATATF